MNEGVDLYAVTGHPVKHSLSPLIHAEFARQTGEILRYVRLDLESHEFADGLSQFFREGGRGVNVTMPHKRLAYELSSAVSASARIAGAVNTLTLLDEDTWCGDLTDGEGLVRDLTMHLGVDVADRRILLIGAGGSARGCLGPLLAMRPARVTIANRTRATAVELEARFLSFGNVRGGGLAETGHTPYDIVINATSTSLADTMPAITPSAVRDAVCYDLMYAAGGTPFTRWAADNGARSVNTGVGMLVEQAAAAFMIWRGVEPDTLPVRRKLATEHGLTF